MLFEIGYCCPDCGCRLWHQEMHQLRSDEYCCSECGSVYSDEELDATNTVGD